VKCSGETTLSWEGLLAHIGCTKPVSLRAGGGMASHRPLTSGIPPFSGKTTTVGLPGSRGLSARAIGRTERCANHATLSVSVAVPALSLFLTERADTPAAAHPTRFRSRAERSSAVRPHRDLRSSSQAEACHAPPRTPASVQQRCWRCAVRGSACGTRRRIG
jgi:hypothetical protein